MRVTTTLFILFLLTSFITGGSLRLSGGYELLLPHDSQCRQEGNSVTCQSGKLRFTLGQLSSQQPVNLSASVHRIEATGGFDCYANLKHAECIHEVSGAYPLHITFSTNDEKKIQAILSEVTMILASSDPVSSPQEDHNASHHPPSSLLQLTLWTQRGGSGTDCQIPSKVQYRRYCNPRFHFCLDLPTQMSIVPNNGPYHSGIHSEFLFKKPTWTTPPYFFSLQIVGVDNNKAKQLTKEGHHWSESAVELYKSRISHLVGKRVIPDQFLYNPDYDRYGMYILTHRYYKGVPPYLPNETLEGHALYVGPGSLLELTLSFHPNHCLDLFRPIFRHIIDSMEIPDLHTVY